MYKLFVFIVICLLFTSISCSDDDPVEPGINYSITIHSPSAEAKHIGDAIHIHVDFDEASDATVHHVNVNIKNKLDGTVLYSEPFVAHVHAITGHYEHHDDVSLEVAGHSDWILEAKVWGHEAGVAEVIETLEFHVHP